MGDHSNRPSRFHSRVNSLGLPASGLAKVLDALEASPGSFARRRAFVRWPFRKESIQLTLMRSGTNDVTLVVACRNISTKGMSLLHCAYIHPGTECAIVLPGLRSSQRALVGRVARCEHRTGMMHEIGVEFEAPIDLRQYVPVAMQLKPSTLEKVSPESLRGVLVHYCESKEERAVFRERFRTTPLIVRSVADTSSLVRQVSLGCDAVLIDAPREQVKEIVKLIRGDGGLVIGGVASSNVEARMLQLSVGGIAGVAVRPFTAEMLVRFVAELLHVKRIESKSDGELSTADTLRILRDAAETALGSDDREKCVAVCEVIELAASQAGLDEIAFAAARAQGLLGRADAGGEKLANLMRPLISMLNARDKWDAA